MSQDADNIDLDAELVIGGLPVTLYLSSHYTHETPDCKELKLRVMCRY